jgi:hypothetical protein
MVPKVRQGRSAATATDDDMADLWKYLQPTTKKVKKTSGKKTRKKPLAQFAKHLLPYGSTSSSSAQPREDAMSSSSRGLTLFNDAMQPSTSSSSNSIFEGDEDGDLAGTILSFKETPASSFKSGEPEMYVHEDWEDTGPYGQAEGLFEDGDEHTYNMGLKVTPGKTNDGKKEGGRKSKKRKSRRRKTRKHKKKHRKRKRKTKRKTKHKKHKRKRKTKHH